MSTVFIGGSRHVSRLPDEARERLNKIIGGGFAILVGDAAGADKAVQKFLVDASYSRVTVFCSGHRARNNLGGWDVREVPVPSHVRGFQFYAAKDREMALRADFGLMIWDGKSAGTALNVLRLMRAGKKAVLLNAPEKRAINFKSEHDWREFVSGCDGDFVEDLRARATPDEWIPVDRSQAGFIEALRPEIVEADSHAPPAKSRDELILEINAALASGDLATVVETLGGIARAHGMSQVAKEAGLARESLYRSLSSGGNPEFSTVMRVISSVGLQLAVSQAVTR